VLLARIPVGDVCPHGDLLKAFGRLTCVEIAALYQERCVWEYKTIKYPTLIPRLTLPLLKQAYIIDCY
jgi:hypothetical protein